MVPEDNFEILNPAAWHAACQFNKNPEDQVDCYDFILYHAVLKLGEEHNASYMRMRCDSLARNWYKERNRHAKRAKYGIDPDELPFTRMENNRYMSPEEQFIIHEEIEDIYRLCAEVGLSDLEMKVITTRAEGFITACQIAEVENVNFSRVVDAAGRARKKLVPVLRETAISKGYNPNGQFAPRLGHSRENKSQNKCGDYYYPKRERKTKLSQLHKMCRVALNLGESGHVYRRSPII